MSTQWKVSGKSHALIKEGGKAAADWRFESRPGGWVIATRELPGGAVERRRIFGFERGTALSANVGGMLWRGEVLEAGAHASGGGGGSDADLNAQFPGKVRKILVKAGDNVAEGDRLVLLEAMKMEFAVKAPRDGKVAKLHVSEGQQLTPGQRLVDLE